MSSRRLLLQDPPLSLRLRSRIDRWPALIRYRRWKRPREADCFVLSYPKAGRTWLRVMMAGLFAEHFGRPELAIGEAGDDDYPGFPGVPVIGAKHDGQPQKRTAAEILSDKREYADCRVIFLVRDIRDLAVSNYFQVTRRVHRFEGNIASYIRWPRGSVDGMLRYYNVWAAQRRVPRDFMLVRYEDLRRAPVDELGRIAHFVGLTGVRQESLSRAVEHGAFDSMKKRESTRPADGSSLAAGRPGDAESFKTRKGKIGGYAEYLSADDVAWLNHRIDTELDPFYGYSSAAEPGPVKE